MTPEDFAAGMDRLQVAFDANKPQALWDLYWEAVGDWPADRWLDAVRRVVATRKHFPRLSEILEAVGGGPEHAAEEAWSQVVRAVRRCGKYHSADLGPIANAAVRDIGGLSALGRMSEDELGFAQARFRRAYVSRAARGVSSDEGRHLPGLHEGVGVGTGVHRFGAGRPAPAAHQLPARNDR